MLKSKFINFFIFILLKFREKTEHLIENGTAYRCFCSDKRLELLRKDAARRGAVPRYDNRCRDLSSNEIAEKMGKDSSFCIRFKVCLDRVNSEVLI